MCTDQGELKAGLTSAEAVNLAMAVAVKTAAAHASTARCRTMRFFMARRSVKEWLHGFLSPEERNYKENEKKNEAYFRDGSGSTGEGAESENTGDKGDNNEGKSPGEHNVNLVGVDLAPPEEGALPVHRSKQCCRRSATGFKTKIIRCLLTHYITFRLRAVLSKPALSCISRYRRGV